MPKTHFYQDSRGACFIIVRTHGIRLTREQTIAILRISPKLIPDFNNWNFLKYYKWEDQVNLLNFTPLLSSLGENPMIQQIDEQMKKKNIEDIKGPLKEF